MSSESPEQLRFFAGWKAYQSRVDTLVVQMGHLGVHIDRDDEVISYWFNIIRRSLVGLSIDFEEEDRAWHEEG